jgi:hypothetical protein
MGLHNFGKRFGNFAFLKLWMQSKIIFFRLDIFHLEQPSVQYWWYQTNAGFISLLIEGQRALRLR